jgi:hypothetical protein
MKKLATIRTSIGIVFFVGVLSLAYFVIFSRANAPTSGTHSLVGSKPSDIAAYAVEYAQSHHEVIKDAAAPTSLLSRPVTRGQITALGLGCLGEYAAAEEPPLDLVILKGNFLFSTSASQAYTLESKYVAYVFDEWSGEVTYRLASIDGSNFRVALNDTTLPVPKAALPSACPTQIPTSMKKSHYGDTAPGISTSPTAVVGASPTASLGAVAPPPVPTAIVP